MEIIFLLSIATYAWRKVFKIATIVHHS